MLDSQISLYSIDTGHFYSNRENYFSEQIFRYRKEIENLKNENLKNTISQSEHRTSLIRHKKKKMKQTKERLATLLANKLHQNERTDGRDHVRHLREQDLRENKIISVFESTLSRTIGIPAGELTDALFVVQVYYDDMFKDLFFYGFIYNGEKYRYFTSSAGQIRTKKAVFIKESVWERIKKTILCGLTIEKINAKGGINANKYLAYMALSNSATDEWKDFDINRCIVIDDFKTNVAGIVDFIDETDYSITRKNDIVPITHTDGIGMMLPSVMSKNTMFRAPWIKGLLGVFDFQKFVEQKGCSPVIADIYGKEHDIFAENIQIIFTKSQFKMHKYYDSWEEYKECFKKFHCQAGLCNMEETRIKKAKINYQMLQTLTDVTDEEIDTLTASSVKKLENICTNEETMKECLGITPYNTHMTPFQQAVKLYPALLNDTYAKDVLREAKDGLVKKYRSGKLEVNGKYTFILPDFYAACEHWFAKEALPNGLLAENEVFCRLYKNQDKLDCLRSPHLYKEHAVRRNVANKKRHDGDVGQMNITHDGRDLGQINVTCDGRVIEQSNARYDACYEWFTTDALYTGSHDLISKILQFDVDGDKSLVIADPDFVRVAERNMQGVVPLYYKMKKAEPKPLNQHNIYAGLQAAFRGGNIGTYSNNISKIWNNDVFIHGTTVERQLAENCIKRLCCQNNFVIDYAKTLYKPEFPANVKKEIRTFTQGKPPAFFEYAKDKEKTAVESRNKSLVNKLYERIPNKPINTRSLHLEPLDYKKMMRRFDLACAKEVSALYDVLNKKYPRKLNRNEEDGNFDYLVRHVRDQFSTLGYSEEMIADMLVQYLYGQKKRSKQLLWLCYGSYIVENLQKNVNAPKTKAIQCTDCGEWVEIAATNNRTLRCPQCQKLHTRKSKTKMQRNYRK